METRLFHHPFDAICGRDEMIGFDRSAGASIAGHPTQQLSLDRWHVGLAGRISGRRAA
jgi:hypothetical protein